jgi:hypothetical protein
VYRQTILQTYARTASRGRLQGVFIAVVVGGPRLGDLRAGASAALVGTTAAWVGGGVASALVAVALRWRSRPYFGIRRVNRATRVAGKNGGGMSDMSAQSLGVRAASGSSGPSRRATTRQWWSRSAAVCGASASAGNDIVDGFGEDELPPGCSGQILAPWPNRIRDGRYTFAGETYQLSLTEPTRHNAIHGLVNWSRWHRDRVRADHVTSSTTCRRSRATRGRWRCGPPGGSVRTGCAPITPATNLAATPCPFGFSVHPYLLLPGVKLSDVRLQVPARNRLLVDGRLLPIGAARVAGTEFDFTEPRRLGSLVLDTAFGDVIRETTAAARSALASGDGRGGSGCGPTPASAGGRSSPATPCPATGSGARWRSSR